MTIYRTSGKNIEIYDEYELYTKEYVENVGGKSSFTADGGTKIGNNPKQAKPLGISNLYVKVRLKEGYNGEFGFDWVDVNPDTKDIEKIQDVPFSEVEYFHKEGNTPDELGNIIEKSTDITGARNAIQKQYKFNNWCKYVDIPYVLIKPNQEIELSAEVVLCEGELKEDYISITGDDFYEFEITGGEKEGKIAKKKITAGEKLNLKIKCLKESSEMTFNFKHYNSTKGETLVGGIIMMENKVLKLKFRVIALVSSDGVPNDKAKALFKKFKDSGVKDYLNKNSLNQAGYEVEIENFAEMDNADVDDYFYAFDKADWGSSEKRYFSKDEKRLRYYVAKNKNGELDTFNEVQEGQVGDYIWETTDSQGQRFKKIKRNNIDIVTIQEYNNKIKNKNKEYNNGGFIILCDLENSQAEIVAFSKSNPLDNYILFMNSPSVELKDIYAHEIGHMLGLPHSFYTQLEINAYEMAKKSIVGNNEPQYLDSDSNNDGKKDENPNYYQGINDFILKQKEDYEKNKFSGYSIHDFYLENDKLIFYLKNYNTYHLNDLKAKNYNESYKQKINNNISINKRVIEENQNSTDCKYKLHKITCYVLPNDYFLYLERRKKYLYDILYQLQNNIVFYKQRSTSNFLDYYNTRVFFSHNQILTMRDDSKNFIEEICTCKQNSLENPNAISKPLQKKTKK